MILKIIIIKLKKHKSYVCCGDLELLFLDYESSFYDIVVEDNMDDVKENLNEMYQNDIQGDVDIKYICQIISDIYNIFDKKY